MPEVSQTSFSLPFEKDSARVKMSGHEISFAKIISGDHPQNCEPSWCFCLRPNVYDLMFVSVENSKCSCMN